MNCPHCLYLLEFDGDFYYCPKCEQTFPPDLIEGDDEG